ncbi:MAG: hypothetical protein ACFBSE_27090 [Prochloraceae cyanobacterium]
MKSQNSPLVITKTQSYSLQVKLAETNAEIVECQSLIADIYYENFGISLCDRSFKPQEKIELYPHYYLMGLVNEELVATIGLYLYNINSQQYARVTDREIESVLNKDGLDLIVSSKSKRELSKFVIKKEWRNKGLGKVFLGLAHSKDFIHSIGDGSHILVNTAFSPMFKVLDSIGIASKLIKTVPSNKVYPNYYSDRPMETRITIPYFDIPSCWYHFNLPGEYIIEVN